MSQIELAHVSKHYGDTPVLDDVNLSIAAGSIVAVLGPSGSGKTTLLRLIAGFERVDGGRIVIGDRVVDDGQRTVRARDRGVGYVAQDGALFPHLTVAGNVGFGLPRAERGAVPQLLDLVGLGEFARRYPHQLSGGQQQRVALARALAIRPHLVLLDEPFGALDATLRASLRRDVIRILRTAGATTILVTHDQDEALSTASTIAILDEQRIVACADPQTLYRHPPSLTVATAIGEANVLSGQISGDRAQCALGLVSVEVNVPVVPRGECRLLIRPEQIVFAVGAAPGHAHAIVIDVDYHGHDALIRLELDGPEHERVLARAGDDLRLSPGQEVHITVVGRARAWAADAPRIAG